MKSLVLGGTRFLGLHLVRHLVSNGHDVTTLNRGKTQTPLPPEVKRLYADRRDPESVRRALSGQEFEVIFDISGYQVRNLEPFVELFDGKVQNYVFQSTVGVYADSRYRPILEDFPRVSGVNEDKGLAYVTDKVKCEDYLLKRYDDSRFPVTILRCPEIYGPDNWMHEREFSFFVRFAERRNIIIPGNGADLLHFVHVDDVCQAHLSVVGKEATLGQAFNIAGPEAITTEGFIDTVEEITGLKAVKVHLAFNVMENLGRPVFPFRTPSNNLWGIAKARELFDFWPAYSIIKGLQNTYQWWQKNLGVSKTRLEPGQFGFDVDLAFEDKLIKQYQIA